MSAPGEELARRLSWLTGLRLSLLSLMLGATIALNTGELRLVGSFSTQIVLVTVAVGFALAAVFASLLRKRVALVPISYVQLVVDQLTWTMLAYVSGGVTSGATSFYGLTCVIGAVVAGVRGVAVTAISAAAFFTAMGLAFASGRLAPPPDQIGRYATAWRDVSYHLSVNLLALSVVAMLAGYLAERLRSTGGQLQEATLRAEQAERLAMLGRFSAGLAHEIRNPLGSIAGSVELLATGPGLGEEDRILCGIIAREASRLNDLVTDMLDLAKPRLPELEEVDLAALAVEVVRLASRSGRGMDVPVVYEGPKVGVVVRADAGQLRQVLWNLVRNAVQASTAGERVSVRVAVREGTTVIEVEDSGVGIPESGRPQLFDAFFTTRTHGIGIGLAVVKRIVDDHGFRIEVDSAKDRGAIFRVIAPTAPPLI